MIPSPRQVVERRRAQRQQLIDRASRYAANLDPALGVLAVAVFGSVARGDFHAHSDIDVLVIAERLPEHPADRLLAVGPPSGGIAAVVWTPDEWVAQRRRRNPIAVEAEADGEWLVGGPPAAGGPADRSQPPA